MSPKPILGSFRTIIAPRTTRAGDFLRELDAWSRRQPYLAAVIATAAKVWDRLFDAFCEVIDPFVQRYYPERRLVVLAGEDGGLTFFSISKTLAAALPDPRLVASHGPWSSVELRLREDQVLRQTLSLPAASRDFLGPVIEHRLERLTPWRREDVLYGYKIAPGSSAGGSISVQFAATSTAIAAGPLAALLEAGFTASALGPGESIAKELEIDFYGQNKNRRYAPWKLKTARIWVASIAAMSLIFVLISFWAGSAAANKEASETHLTKARRLLKIASEGAIGSQERALISLKVPEKSTVVLIDKLSNVIPATTYLRELNITEDRVALSGVSRDAAALIGILDKAGLHDVHFTAPTTRDAARTDHFDISASRNVSKPPGTP